MIEQSTIGQVAKRARVNVQTVLYYERRGLLRPDGRRDSGYRFYGPEAARKIRFIKNAQELGFTLEEISGLLRLRVGNRSRCSDVRKKAQKKLGQVDDRIAGLKAIRRALMGLVRTCRSRGTTDSCPILKSLEDAR